MYIVEKCIKDVFHALGIDIGRVKPKNDPNFILLKALQHFGVDVVLDIGANTGQFARDLRQVGFGGDIVSFEPLSAAHAALVHNARHDPRWHIHPRCAIGAQEGEASINIAGNSVSSSLLPMLGNHTDVVPESAYCNTETTPVHMLDNLADTYLHQAKAPFLKIDTQGYEWQVLDGALNTLPKVRGVLCEMSLVPLYEGQYLWKDILARMEAAGFTLWSLRRGFTDLGNGRAMQMDGLFFRL